MTMDKTIDLFFEVSSLLRSRLRKHSAGIISIIEMRGLQFIASNTNAKQKDLGLHWGITDASISAFISKMEGLGLVKRTRDPNDKRASILSVTAKGQIAIDEMLQKARQISRPDFAALSEPEGQELARLLKKLLPR